MSQKVTFNNCKYIKKIYSGIFLQFNTELIKWPENVPKERIYKLKLWEQSNVHLREDLPAGGAGGC